MTKRKPISKLRQDEIVISGQLSVCIVKGDDQCIIAIDRQAGQSAGLRIFVIPEFDQKVCLRYVVRMAPPEPCGGPK